MNSPYEGEFRVTQVFKGATHKGLDLVGVTSKTIRSTVNGIVQVAGWDSIINKKYGMGLYVRIKGEDGRYYYFAHLSKTFVTNNTKVKKGDAIGVEGSTGKSTGSHLHYEIRKATNNMTYLDVSKISGIPNKLGIYNGGDIMTKAEVLAILKEYLDGNETEVSSWAMPSWTEMTQKKITDGQRPKGYATREEIITLIDRALKLK